MASPEKRNPFPLADTGMGRPAGIFAPPCQASVDANFLGSSGQDFFSSRVGSKLGTRRRGLGSIFYFHISSQKNRDRSFTKPVGKAIACLWILAWQEKTACPRASVGQPNCLRRSFQGNHVRRCEAFIREYLFVPACFQSVRRVPLASEKRGQAPPGLRCSGRRRTLTGSGKNFEPQVAIAYGQEIDLTEELFLIVIIGFTRPWTVARRPGLDPAGYFRFWTALKPLYSKFFQ